MKASPLITSLFIHAAIVAAFNWDVLSHPIVKDFKWSIPFPDDDTPPGGFKVPCQAVGTFHANQHKLADLKKAESPWAGVVESMIDGHTYPGSWDGVDHKHDKREVIMMEYKDVPTPVRDWIDAQQHDTENGKTWLFGVYQKPKPDSPRNSEPRWTSAKGDDIPDEDKILVFPAGAIYEILPLWVAKGSNCEAELLDLSKYGPQAKDEGVIAWPVEHKWPDTKHGKTDISFKIKAYYVLETPEGRAHRLFWEKAHLSIRRHERRQKRKEREEARKQLQLEEKYERVKDEL